VVRWGQGPLAFELRSSDDEIASRVATVVASWQPNSDARLSRRWRVERAESPTGDLLWEGWVAGAEDVSETSAGRAEPAALMQAIEFDGVRELLHCREQILGLHSALVSRTTPAGERGVALIGPCFSGKSTLSCALWNSGWSFLGDDVTLFDQNGYAYPAPRRAWMRHSSRELVGEALWARAEAAPSSDNTSLNLLFHPHEVDGQSRPRHTRLDAIVFLSRYNAQSEPAQLTRVAPVDGAIALLPYSNLRNVTFASALSRMAPVAETVPIYDLGRGPLSAMIGELSRLMASSTLS
jgi:hypothetical protein